ncbi:hypothetical protein ACTID9_21410 [Brevibacillus fluminis]|uniref:hypothetical protein n=1 Tax=Brevibacillus fluminis TaxID=511487 RepID=UPI003F89A87F
MNRKTAVWLAGGVLLIAFLIVCSVKTSPFGNNIVVVIVNESGQTVNGAAVEYFNQRETIPPFVTGGVHTVVLDISEHKGEGTVTYTSSQQREREVLLCGYIEGGKPGLYRGKITVRLLKNGKTEVEKQPAPFSIL